jgi:hypothetical protein
MRKSIMGLALVVTAVLCSGAARAQSQPAGYWEGWEDLAGCVDASGDPEDDAHVGYCGSVEQGCESFNQLMGNPGLVTIEVISQKRAKCYYNSLFTQTIQLLCPSAKA